MKGTIKWFHDIKGYGFIQPAEGGDDIFVHKTGIRPEFAPYEGAKVEFDVSEGKKGPKAVNVSECK